MTRPIQHDNITDIASLQPCSVSSPDRMTCRSPSLVGSGLNVSGSASTALNFGLFVDGVVGLRNLSSRSAGDETRGTTMTFAVFPDPQFDEFEDGVKKFFFLPNEYLTINVSLRP